MVITNGPKRPTYHRKKTLQPWITFELREWYLRVFFSPKKVEKTTLQRTMLNHRFSNRFSSDEHKVWCLRPLRRRGGSYCTQFSSVLLYTTKPSRKKIDKKRKSNLTLFWTLTLSPSPHRMVWWASTSCCSSSGPIVYNKFVLHSFILTSLYNILDHWKKSMQLCNESKNMSLW